MNWHTWDEPTRALYQTLQEYCKAFDQYSKASPSPEVARARFDAARDNLIASVRNPSVSDRIERVINSDDGSFDNDADIVSSLGRELDLEINLSRYFGVKRNQVKKVFEENANVNAGGNSVKSVDQLASEIERLHDDTVKHMEEARVYSKRLPKKKRKKSIEKGVISMIFGSGCFVANSYTSPVLPSMAASYGVGLFALHQAARDIIGQQNGED